MGRLRGKMAGSGLNGGQGQGVRSRGIGWKKKRLDVPAKAFRAKYSGEAAGVFFYADGKAIK